jgi:hypothetical protein
MSMGAAAANHYYHHREKAGKDKNTHKLDGQTNWTKRQGGRTKHKKWAMEKKKRKVKEKI